MTSNEGQKIIEPPPGRITLRQAFAILEERQAAGAMERIRAAMEKLGAARRDDAHCRDVFDENAKYGGVP